MISEKMDIDTGMDTNIYVHRIAAHAQRCKDMYCIRT